MSEMSNKWIQDEYLGKFADRMVQAKCKYADNESLAYLRGTWSKTKKYQTVIFMYLRYVNTRIIAPGEGGQDKKFL